VISKEEFIELFGNKEPEKVIHFAKVDPNYVSGRPSLVFGSESVATVKKYTYLSSYTPAANDRVILVGGVILGKII
jgi:hypothetical protein